MIARFFAQRIINKRTTFGNVPELLKEQVKQALIEEGYEHLAKEGGN